jgi:hypothetical protein
MRPLRTTPPIPGAGYGSAPRLRSVLLLSASILAGITVLLILFLSNSVAIHAKVDNPMGATCNPDGCWVKIWPNAK